MDNNGQNEQLIFHIYMDHIVNKFCLIFGGSSMITVDPSWFAAILSPISICR